MERKQISILQIEDNPGDVRLIKEMLKEVKSPGCLLRHASDLASGIEFLKSQEFDLILLDLGLPDSMGLSTLEKIHSINSIIPIVIMTGLDDEELGLKAVKTGAQDYLVKSEIDPDILIRSIRYAIERKRIDEKLRRSEERFRSTFDQAAVGLAHVSLVGDWLRVNEKLSNILGYSPAELLGMNCLKMTHPDDLPEDARNIDLLLKYKTKTYTIEKRYQHKNGQYVWCQLTRSLVEESPEAPKYFLSVIQDISKRKQTELALLDSEQRLRTIFRESPSAIVITSMADGRYIDINEAFQRITGYSRTEIIGRRISEVDIFANPSDRRNIYKAIEKNGEIRNMEFEFRLKSGDLATGLLQATVLNIESEPQMLSVVTDITERKQAMIQIQQYVDELQANKVTLENNAREMNELNQKLKELNTSKDKFFSIVAHDLRSPFSALLGFSEYMYKHIEELTPDEIKDFSFRIYKSLNSLLKLIENLLQWARIHTGKMEFAPALFSLNDLLDEILNVYNMNAARKNIKILCSPDQQYSLFADKDMMDSVLRNLLSNAIKFTSSGGEIRISARKASPYVEVSVSDTGIGIDKDDIERMFRIDETMTREGTEKEKGTGLGLVLCREFVEMNGGTISVESEIGKGSTFRFTVPGEYLK
ncbi:MAG: PAS domain S-box protein [Ignavibacteria bacterium]|jgi:PAS domain S-box-containing protein|nr:PAS domain S-box protein [Ignavibacteria bacterium]MCU7520080.1 PAS domain S-box protein [Ignavibacteria bacterium]